MCNYAVPLNSMTDLDKAIFLAEHVGKVVHFYHRVNGDSTGKIIAVDTTKRTFEYTVADATQILTMSFSGVVEFDFRKNGIPPAII